MLTKFDVGEGELAALAAPVGELAASAALTGGIFASAHRLDFADGRRAVIKIVGGDESRLCTYERGVLRTEELIYRSLAGSGVPVPQVIRADFSRSILDADALIVEHLPGVPWQSVELDAAQTTAVRRNLGRVIADIHRVRGPRYGYPAGEAGLSADSWRAAFTAMVNAVLDDAERWDVDLPTDRVRAVVAKHTWALDDVRIPVIVHTDLWEGNVFIDPESMEVVGIIDTERAIWGDPLHELVGVDQFGTGDPDSDLLLGNSRAGGVLQAALDSASGPTRLQLCRMYFSLILVVEPTIRGYDPQWGVEYEAGARANLDRALAILEAPPAR